MNFSWVDLIMAGGLAALVLFFFTPGLKQTIRESREEENPDWMGALVPLGLVVLFIVLLLMLA